MLTQREVLDRSAVDSLNGSTCSKTTLKTNCSSSGDHNFALSPRRRVCISTNPHIAVPFLIYAGVGTALDATIAMEPAARRYR